MEKSDKFEGILQKIFGSSDAFTSAQEVMLALLIVPYCIERGGVVALALLPVAAVLPIALMPLVYAALHRFDTLLFGRYHLIMPLSALLAAPFFVLAFSASEAGTASSVCKIFFGFLFFVIFSLTYRYCSFSVRARLYGENVQRPKLSTLCIATVGAVAAVGTFIGFWFYKEQDAFVNSAYVIAGAGLVLAVAQYLTTFYGIPKLGGKRVQPVKAVYRAFYAGIDARSYLSSFLFAAALAVQAALSAYLCVKLTDEPSMLLVVSAAALAAFLITGWLLTKFVKRRSLHLSIAAGCCFVVAAALDIVAAFVPMTSMPIIVLVAVSAVIFGAGGAVTLRQMRLRMLSVKRELTSGIVQMLMFVTCYAAAAVGLLTATIVGLFNGVAAVGYAFGFSAALAIVGLGLGSKRSVAATSPALSYEIVTLEREPDGNTEVVINDEEDGASDEINNDKIPE